MFDDRRTIRAMSRGRDYLTRAELVETVRERFRKIEEVGGRNGQAEGGGAVGSFEADGGLTNKQNVRMEANAGYAVKRIPAARRIT
jgi:hypothetical protein